MKKFASIILSVVLLAAMVCAFAVPASADIISPGISIDTVIDLANVLPTADGFQIKSEVDPETLTIVGVNVDAANRRVLLKVGAETATNVDAAVANFLNVTVKKGATVNVIVEHSEFLNGPWHVLDGVGGITKIERAGSDIEVKLNGKLPAQGFFRAKVEELEDGEGSVLSEGNVWIIIAIAVVVLGGIVVLVIVKKKKKPATAGGENKDEE